MIVRGRERIDPQADRSFYEEVDWFTDEDDASASGTTNVSLESHLTGVCLPYADVLRKDVRFPNLPGVLNVPEGFMILEKPIHVFSRF